MGIKRITKLKKMKFATTFIAAASAAGMGSANDAGSLNCPSDAQVTNCWEAYATFIPSANQTAGGDVQDFYGTWFDIQTTEGNCGISIAEATSMVNQTCEVEFTAGGVANIGGTAFAAGTNANGDAETKPMIMFSNNSPGSANNEFAIANAGDSVSSGMGDVTFDASTNGAT